MCWDGTGRTKTEGGVEAQEKRSQNLEKVKSFVRAGATLVLGSVPASTFLGDATGMCGGVLQSAEYGVGVLVPI